MNARSLTTSLLAASLLLAAAAAGAQDWTNWRGPHFNGSSDEVNLPVKFSRTEGVKWAAELPGPSAGTPIISGDSVFVSSTDFKTQELLALCLDRKTGALKWRRTAGTGYQPAGKGNALQLDEKSNYASPSPVTDGKRVVFFYGNGDMVCFDFAGKELWRKNLQKEYGDFSFGWTFSSSPQLYDGRLYMQILQRDHVVSDRGKEGAESFLLAMEPATGKQIWRVVRPTLAKMESREAFTTPIPYEDHGRKMILMAGGDMLSANDAITGKEIWRWGTWNVGHSQPYWRLVPSPCAGAGMVIACAPKKEPVFAVKTDNMGDVSDKGLVWQSEAKGVVTSDVPTPLFYKGNFYIASDVRKSLSCVEPATGKVAWSVPTPGTAMCWASPTGADGKIYLMSLRGEVHVFDAADGKLLATNPMAEQEEELRSTVAVSQGNLFIRTERKLYCVGK